MIKTLKATYAESTIARVLERNKQLGLIHAAKASLCLTDEAYQAMVLAASGSASTSSADLNARQRGKMLRALGKLGFVASQTPSPKQADRLAQRAEDLAVIHQAARATNLPEADYRKLVTQASHGKSKARFGGLLSCFGF